MASNASFACIRFVMAFSTIPRVPSISRYEHGYSQMPLITGDARENVREAAYIC